MNRKIRRAELAAKRKQPAAQAPVTTMGLPTHALALAEIRAGRAQEALPMLAALAQDHAGDSMIANDGAVARALTGDLPGATQQLAALVAAAPGHSIAHYNLGQALAALGQLPAAADALRACTAADPQHGEAWFLLGEVLLELRQDSDAADASRRAALMDQRLALKKIGTAFRRWFRRGPPKPVYELSSGEMVS